VSGGLHRAHLCTLGASIILKARKAERLLSAILAASRRRCVSVVRCLTIAWFLHEPEGLQPA
jgi:hypothetical protein